MPKWMLPALTAATLACGLFALPVLAAGPGAAPGGRHGAATATPVTEAVEVGVGGYYGYPYGYRYRYRYGHWGYPAWYYDPWPRSVYYGPPARWAGYPPAQPLWTGSSVVWLHPAPPGPVVP